MGTPEPDTPSDQTPATSNPSAWGPFRSRDFTRMASAQFLSNVGGWMQTIGAQEVMRALATSATLGALIQTAAGLPVVLLAVPAGAIGDLVDRRRLLIASQAFMLLAALALAGLTLAGLVTPWVLLALIFAVGAGQTLTSPTWQTLQPELVAPEDRTQAIALGAVNQNLSRAVGPAIGGALYAASGAAALFFVNAASFVPVLGAVARWRGGARPRSAAAPEQVLGAMRAGARYIAASPSLRVILLRAGMFMFFANSIWALLPLVARTRLHLGSGGYGLLLGGVGIGAVAGAAVLPRLRGGRRGARDRWLHVDSRALDAELALSVHASGMGEGPRHVLLPGGLPGRGRARKRGVRRVRSELGPHARPPRGRRGARARCIRRPATAVQTDCTARASAGRRLADPTAGRCDGAGGRGDGERRVQNSCRTGAGPPGRSARSALRATADRRCQLARVARRRRSWARARAVHRRVVERTPSPARTRQPSRRRALRRDQGHDRPGPAGDGDPLVAPWPTGGRAVVVR